MLGRITSTQLPVIVVYLLACRPCWTECHCRSRSSYLTAIETRQVACHHSWRSMPVLDRQTRIGCDGRHQHRLLAEHTPAKERHGASCTQGTLGPLPSAVSLETAKLAYHRPWTGRSGSASALPALPSPRIPEIFLCPPLTWSKCLKIALRRKVKEIKKIPLKQDDHKENPLQSATIFQAEIECKTKAREIEVQLVTEINYLRNDLS